MKLVFRYFLFLTFLGVNSVATAETLAESLNKVKSAAKPISVGLAPGTSKKVILHLFWATWCEYCDQVSGSLSATLSNPKYADVAVHSYSFDEGPVSPQNEKLKKMGRFVNYQTSYKIKDLPDSLTRLPVTIVEDVKRKTFKAYSGFSNERYKTLKKTIDRALELPDQDDN